MSEKFSLKWNDFQANVSKSFGVYRNEDYLQDVTLVGDDHKQVRAQKLVLSTSSEYFRDIFKNNKQSNIVLCLQGMRSVELNRVLDYIYNGEVQLYQEDLDNFLEIAQRLKLDGLINDGQAEGYDVGNKTENFGKYEYITKPDAHNLSDKITDNEQKVDNEQSISETDMYKPHRSRYQIDTFGNESLQMSFTEKNEIDEKVYEFIKTLGPKEFQCTQCGKIASKKSNLVKHVETHIEGLSYPCKICGKTFRSRNILFHHKYSFHK